MTEDKIIALGGKKMTFRDAMLHATAVGITNEWVDYEDEEVILELADETHLRVRSNYDGPYSDVTPGNGIERPTVYLLLKRPPPPA